MPWQGTPDLPYTRQGILDHAPSAPGVYVISNGSSIIYVGESRDVQARLLAHVSGDNVCITMFTPTAWAYELVAAEEGRAARQVELIRELSPACNQRPG